MSVVRFANAGLQGGFVQIPNALLLDTTVSVPARMTWVLLAKFAWQKGYAFPGQETLGQLLGGVVEKTVRGYLSELTEAGWLEVQRRGQGQTNVYLLLIPDRTLTTGLDGTPTTGQDRSLMTDEEDTSKKTKKESSGGGAEHPLFDAWLDHHMAVTTHKKPRLGTKRRADIHTSFRARFADQLLEAGGDEQAALDRMKAANHGAQNDTWRRENGYTTAESLLRPTKFGQLVDRGMKALRDEQDKGEGQGSGKWD